MTSFRAAFLAALCSIFLASCGDTFRPIAVPVAGTVPAVQASKTAEVVTDSGALTGTVTNYNLSGGTVTGQAALGQAPVATALVGSRMYVANQADNTLSVFSALAPQSPPPGTITLENNSSPQALAVSPIGAAVYVAYKSLNAVGVVSTSTNTVSGFIPLTANGFTGTTPEVLVTNLEGTKLIVGNTGSDNISVIDLAAGAVVGTIGGCSHPSAIVQHPTVGYVFVACRDSNNLIVVNTNTGFGDFNIPVGTAPSSLAFDATNKRLIVTNGGSSSVSFLNEDVTQPSTLHAVTTVPIGAPPVAATALPDGSRVYVATAGTNVVVIDSTTLTVKTNIAIGAAGQQIAASSDSLRVAVTTAVPNTLRVIDTSTESLSYAQTLVGTPKTLLVF